MHTRSQSAKQLPSDEPSDNEYGLKDLATLPLLEQVHRLFHAIQQKYPYTETNAWKCLPLEQKRKMLKYIRERRIHQTDNREITANTATSLDSGYEASVPTAVTTHTEQNSTPKTDLYLQMIQKRTLDVRTRGVTSTGASKSYEEGQQQLEKRYIDIQVNKKRRMQAWAIDNDEGDVTCESCGKKHENMIQRSNRSSANMLLVSISAMMSTFGDTRRPCLATVKQTKTIGT